jgi:hypothetical protein
MSVRKRTWTTARGEIKEAWIVDYTDVRRAICSLSDRDDQRIGHSIDCRCGLVRLRLYNSASCRLH